MPDEPTEVVVDVERNRRVFGRMLGWLLDSGRRPGMIGRAVSFTGTTASGRATVRRRDDNSWVLDEAGTEEDLGSAGLLELVGTGRFFPQRVNIVPDLADLLFKEAVHRAEDSLAKLNRAGSYIDEMTASSGQHEANDKVWLMPYVMASTELDRCVRASISSIVLAIAAAEAQVNTWAAERGGWSADEDRLAVSRKCAVLAARVGCEVSLGAAPYQALHRATKRRNSFVHSRPILESLPAIGLNAPVPGRTMSVEARATCRSVRDAFIHLSRLLDTEAPSYLAYCPPVEPEDEQVWGTATVMTGVRGDPDFPPLSDRVPET